MNGEAKNVLTAMGFGVPLGTIVVWVLETFYLAQGIPSEVAVSFGTVLGGVLHVVSNAVRCFFRRRKSHVSIDDDSLGDR